MNYLTDETGKPHTRFYPEPVRDVGLGSQVTAITGETITFKTGAAGFKGIVNFAKKPILNASGTLIGSYWREPQNLMLESSPYVRVTALTETATAADITIKIESGATNKPNLEQLFEVTTGDMKYVLVAIDPSGNELYGWIKGVSSSNPYTLNITNVLAGTTQSWVGNLSNFDSSDPKKCGFQIYSYESSVVWTTGTILTQEKSYNPALTDSQILNDILTTNGDYAIDYFRGRLFYRKATTGTSDTVAYSVSGSVGGGVSATDNASFTTGSSTTTPMSALVDEVSTGSVTEGNTGVVRMTATRELRNAETYAPVAEDNTVGVLKVEQRFSPSYISTATTTTIKSGAGFLHTITITEAVASTIIVYDNTAGSGTILASFVASAAVGTYHFNVSFGTGLTIVTAGASKLTTSYR